MYLVSRFLKLSTIWVGIGLSAFSPPSWAATDDCPSLQPAAAERGAKVRLTAKPQVPIGEVRWIPPSSSDESPSPIEVLAADGSFNVPKSALGDYLIEVTTGAPESSRQCRLHFQITPPPTAKLRLQEFQPAGTYDFASAKWGPAETPVERITANMQLRGSGFLTDIPEDNRVLIDGKEVPVDWSRLKGDGVCPPLPDLVTTTLGRVVNEREIQLCFVPFNRELALVSLMQHDVPVTPVAFRLFRLHTAKAAMIAAGTTLLLALSIVGLAYCYRLTQPAERRSEYNLVKSLLLDMETDTYSLSKFQFYVWTIAAIFGYIYLVISRMFVQGLSWPDIPGNVPAIIGIGAGTFVASQVVTNVRGPKGSGTERPNLGDLIMSGGVAAVDRVQMLLWTVVGAAIFCRAVLRYAPGEIDTLDAVPDTLMYLMGLSSAGYLGGKFARKPGPVINEISITPSQSDAALMDAAIPPPDVVPSLTPHLDPARAVLNAMTGRATTQAARAAVDKLAAGVAAIEKVTTQERAVQVAHELQAAKWEAHEAATTAATAFRGRGRCSQSIAVRARAGSRHLLEAGQPGYQAARYGRSPAARAANHRPIQHGHHDLGGGQECRPSARYGERFAQRC